MQAAWIVDDEGKGEAAEDEDEEEAMEGGVSLDEEAMEAESEDDDNDTDKEGSVISEQDNGRLGLSSRATSVWEGEDDDHSEIMEDDDDLTPAQRKEEIGRLKAAAHAADEEFPDEVDTPTDVPARQRFAKYRGLKSLRTSPWDPKESLPWEYARIFAFENFVRTQKNVLARAKQNDTGVQEGCMNTGLFVRLHVKNVPAAAAARLLGSYNKIPVVACGLLQHESKMSVLHFR
jgi:pre-rRNA-processing protein TSR1